MFRFNFLILFLCLLFLPLAHAQESSTTALDSQLAQPEKSSLTLFYTSWMEQMNLGDGVSVDQATAGFYGNGLVYSRESDGETWGHLYDVGFVFGQATAGGTQSVLTYQADSQKWWGAQASYQGVWVVSPQVLLSAGPFVLYRKINWPSQGTVTSVHSGSDLNGGILAQVNLRLNKNWEIRQSIGKLVSQATTLWSLGLGYEF